jgi:ankyrin repeat protein
MNDEKAREKIRAAIDERDARALKEALAVVADEPDPWLGGATGLARAAAAGFEEGVVVLLEAGSDPLAVNDRGRTALMEAARWGRAGCVALLLGRSDARAADNAGLTALMLASEAADPAAAGECARLLAPQSDPEAVEAANGETALMIAAQGCSERGLREPLLRALAPLCDPMRENAEGRTALEIALRAPATDLEQRLRCVETLLEAGGAALAEKVAGRAPRERLLAARAQRRAILDAVASHLGETALRELARKLAHGREAAGEESAQTVAERLREIGLPRALARWESFARPARLVEEPPPEGR